MTIRVIQWATGPVGLSAMRAVIEQPDYELVGVFVYNEQKAGTDAGTLVGLPPTGVLATTVKADIVALEADIVIHAAANSRGIAESIEDIIALLASGKSVISTTSFVHLPTIGKDVERRFQEACRIGQSRFFAAGEHPGFMFERLAVSLTTLSQRIDRIVVQEFVDCSHITQVDMLTHMMGMGKKPDEITTESPVFQLLSLQFEQSVAAAAAALGLALDEIRTEIQTVTLDRDLALSCTTLDAGTVVGQILTWTGYSDDKPVLVAEEYWTCTNDIPGWRIPTDGHTVRVRIDGAPRMELELNVDVSPIPELNNMSGGIIAVAMSAVRAIPDVLDAPEGIVVPRIFGAHRWSQSHKIPEYAAIT